MTESKKGVSLLLSNWRISKSFGAKVRSFYVPNLTPFLPEVALFTDGVDGAAALQFEHGVLILH